MGYQKSLFIGVALTLTLVLASGCSTAQSLPTTLTPTSTDTPASTSIAVPTATPTLLPTSTRISPSITPMATTRSSPAKTPMATTLTTTLETGWVLYEKPAEGFALALPPTWKQIDMDPNSINTDLDLIEESNPEVGKFLRQAARVFVTSGFKFWGVDLDPVVAKVGSLTQISVDKKHSEIKISLGAYVSALIAFWEDQPDVIKPVTHQRVKLAGSDAEELRIKMAVTTTNTTTTTVMTQYILIKDQDFYSIGMGTRAEQAEKYAPIFAKIAQSFHIVDQTLLQSKLNEADTHYSRGEFDDAITDYTTVIQLKPDYADTAYYKRGNAYAAKGDYDRAIADYTKAIDLNPDYVEAYGNRGNAYAGKGYLDAAIANYDKAIDLNPNLAESYVNRGLSYAHKGEYDHAIADYDKAIQLKPDYVLAYGDRGIAYQQQGQQDKAAADFRKVLELSNDPQMRAFAEKQLQALLAK
jgi:tetratricopeptide (TPR) repeat protein